MKKLSSLSLLLGLGFSTLASAAESNYYATSQDQDDYYLINQTSIRTIQSTEYPKMKSFDLLWFLKSDRRPDLSWVELSMVANCDKEGAIAIAGANGFNAEGKMIESERANSQLAPDWMDAPPETHFNVAWKKACSPDSFLGKAPDFKKSSPAVIYSAIKNNLKSK